jgi:hypothetical protein
MTMTRFNRSLAAKALALIVTVGSIGRWATVLKAEDPCRNGTMMVSLMEMPNWTYAEIVQRSHLVAIVEPQSAAFTPVLGPLLLDGKTHAMGSPITTFDVVIEQAFAGGWAAGDVVRISQEGGEGYCIDPSPDPLMEVGRRYLVTALSKQNLAEGYFLFPRNGAFIRIDSAEQEAELLARIEGIVNSRSYSRHHPSRP